MSLGRFLANSFLRALGIFVKPIIVSMFRLHYRNIDRVNPLPPLKKSLLLLPAHVVAKKIRAREITSQEVVEAYIERIEQVQPLINCVVQNCFEEALENAKRIDVILSSDKIPEEYSVQAKPLLGVPFSCKECFWVKGMQNATGTLARRDFRSPEDAEIVHNMRQAGGVLTCLTNTSELCIWLESRNPLYGVSKNPYNLSRIVGGSSGGEAALISSAGSLIGIGSDIGGSIRIPPCFNGVYGHKTTYGLIGCQTQYPPVSGTQKESMLTAGPICRYASDLMYLVKIQAGERFEPYKTRFETKVDLKSLNYYVINDFSEVLFASKVSNASSDAIHKAVTFIESSLDVKVKKLDLENFKDIFEIWDTMMNNGETKVSVFNNLLEELQGEPYSAPKELLKQMLGRSKYSLHVVIYTLFEKLPKQNPETFLKLREQLKEELNTILGDNSIIIAPSFPFVAPYHNQPILTNPFDFIYFGAWNALCLPVTQCPMGLCKETGLPVGVQVVSNEKCDNLTIRLAEYFEENNIGWTPGFLTQSSP